MPWSFARTVARLPLLLCSTALASHAALLTLQLESITGDASTYVEQGYELRSDAVITAVFERFDFPLGSDALVRLEWSNAPHVLLDAFEVEFTAGLHVNVMGRHAGSAAVFNLRRPGPQRDQRRVPLAAGRRWPAAG